MIKENKWEEIEQLVPISNNDLDFLCGKLQELAALLTDYTALRTLLDRPEKQKWIKDTYILDGLWNIILNTIPRELANRKSNLALLGKLEHSNTSFEWRYDYFGRSLGPVREKQEDIHSKGLFLCQLDGYLKTKTSGVGGIEIVRVTVN